MKVFVVENHADSRVMLCLMLGELGCEVESAENVADALTRVPQARPDMLISDIGLPDGDGWDLLGRLPDPRAFYAVAMSGFGMASDRVRSKAAGFRHHLIKPIDLNQLERVLDEARAERG